MPRSFEKMADALRGSARAAFERANPRFWGELRGQLDAVLRARSVLDEGERMKAALVEGYEATRHEKIAAEVLLIAEERSRERPELRPEHAAHNGEASLTEEAKRRVGLRFRADMKGVQEVTSQMIEELKSAVSEGRSVDMDTKIEEGPAEETMEREKHFKARVHEALEKFQTARSQATRTFYNERERLIEEARERGSENPELDVSRAQREVRRRLEASIHRDIHDIYQEFGWDPKKQHVAFVSEANGRDVGREPDEGPGEGRSRER